MSDASAPACDLGKPFSAPALVGGAINSLSHDDGFWLLPDLLTVFTSGTRPLDASVGDFDIYTATRSTPDAAFGALSVSSVSTALPDRTPMLTADGKTLYFTRGYTPYEIYVATRSSALVPFDPAKPADAPLNGSGNNQASWVSPDGTTLYFFSDRPGSAASDIYVATRNGAGFGAPVLVASLNSADSESNVVLSADELQAFVSSNRSGGAGSADIYYATRANKSAGFSTPIPLTEINSAVGEYPTWVSPDGCTLYFTARNREGGLGEYDTFVSTRGK